MASNSSRFHHALFRAISSVPFLFVAIWCFRTMEPEKIVAFSQPAAASGFIDWDGGKLKMLDRFYGVEALDQAFRGAMASFAPSTLGYDSISSWQFFHFLVDMGPIYTIWFLESSRALNAWSPAYFPTFFALLGQVVGVGTVVPLFYFLCIVFRPTQTDLARAPRRQSHFQGSIPVVPLIMLFHTSVVFAMFLAPDLSARHYWTWAWQLSPLWIGLGNVAAHQAAALLGWKGSPSSSSFMAPGQMLGVMGLISAGVWTYTLLSSPHSLGTLFVPQAGPQAGLALHMRKALQADEVGVVIGIFLWLAYCFAELHVGGLLGNGWLLYFLLGPVAILCVGPGAAFALGWYARERILEAVGKP
ncbi:hypothetical protein PG993_013424 [Apiospora rasikravindrae]|uniref:Uncharacterized protein n=1 Tax=Apiospora rasikravindrae TaxID=990691 RepID=A0ABR1RYU7_9PEZI